MSTPARDHSMPTAADQPLYRGLDRTQLDLAYNNTRAVAGFPAILADFQARSARLYETRPGLRGAAYGPDPRQRFDGFACGRPDAPVFIFIHGGYWQATTKEDFAFIAEGPLAQGFDVVLAEYTLAPEASMTRIVADIGRLLDHLAATDGEFGLRGRRVVLSGHSAGGHLTAQYRSHPAVTHAMPISALVDLEPISLCWLNDKLQLTPAEIQAFSPLRQIGEGVPTLVTVGADELPELVRHSRDYALAAQQAGQTVRYLALPGCHHFSVLDDLARPDGMQMRGLLALIDEGLS
ncbi:MAG: alpha/beta hydrolase [Zoogloea sp.]|nr:alpha/beta hydrolase [Zoogloea sp.]MCA0185643.1 alpha/beta hydrolase [Pseudomonadota bacterium]